MVCPTIPGCTVVARGQEGSYHVDVADPPRKRSIERAIEDLLPNIGRWILKVWQARLAASPTAEPVTSLRNACTRCDFGFCRLAWLHTIMGPGQMGNKRSAQRFVCSVLELSPSRDRQDRVHSACFRSRACSVGVMGRSSLSITRYTAILLLPIAHHVPTLHSPPSHVVSRRYDI